MDIVVNACEQKEISTSAMNNDDVVVKKTRRKDEDDDDEAPDSPLDASCQAIQDEYSDYFVDQLCASVVVIDSGKEHRRPSPVWKYFVYRRTYALCKLCKRALKRSGGSTTNCFQHLRRYHRRQYAAVMEEHKRRKKEAAARDLVR